MSTLQDLSTVAALKMRAFNPKAVIARDDDRVCMIEDVADDPKSPNYRLYRMEYIADLEGTHAVAYCRYNPWGSLNGGETYPVGHVAEDGFLCLGGEHRGRQLADSPYSLDFVIRRARFWCTAFSVLKETGQFPNL